MCGRTVEVEVVLLDILAVVSLAVREPKQALFQDRVSLVPQRQRKAQLLLVIAEAPESVLAPPVGAGARLVMGEVVPGVAVVAVVLPDCPPLALAEVGTPFLPKDVRLARLVQPFLLRGLYYRVHFSPPLLHQWSRQKSGGDIAVSSEFVIAGMIFHPSRVKSELLHKDIEQSFVELTLLPACHREDVWLLALLHAQILSTHQIERRQRGVEMKI